MKLQKLVEATKSKEKSNAEFMDYVNELHDPDQTEHPLSEQSVKLLAKIGADLIKRGFVFEYAYKREQPHLNHPLCRLTLPRKEYAERDATSRMTLFLTEPVWTNLQICNGGLVDFAKIDMGKFLEAAQEAHVAHAKIKELTTV